MAFGFHEYDQYWKDRSQSALSKDQLVSWAPPCHAKVLNMNNAILCVIGTQIEALVSNFKSCRRFVFIVCFDDITAIDYSRVSCLSIAL